MIFSERMKLSQEYGEWIDERSREFGFQIRPDSMSLLAFLDTRGMLAMPCSDVISRSHFEERVRLAGGMAEGEMTKDFEEGILTVLEMLKTEEPVTIKGAQKLVPKAVFYQGDGYSDGHLVYDEAQCPECETWFEENSENWETPFCPRCGQALDWNMATEEDNGGDN